MVLCYWMAGPQDTVTTRAFGDDDVPPSRNPKQVDDRSSYFGEPPSARLVTAEKVYLAGVGSHSWTRESRGEMKSIYISDWFGLLTPEDTILFAPGDSVVLDLVIPFPPSEVIVWTNEVGHQKPRERLPGRLTWDSGRRSSISVSLKQIQQIALPTQVGIYTLAVHASWSDLGDVLYGFLVEIRDDD